MSVEETEERRSELAVELPRLGRYQLLRRLAVGGMAEIFLARTTGIGGFRKNVVVKRVLPHLSTDEDFLRMFLAEARISADLQHTHIAQVFDVDRGPDSLFFVMEYVPGWDLGALLRRMADQTSTLPFGHAIAIAVGVCKGLHYAHERRDVRGSPLNIVHRDVSPANVLLSEDGNVKLIDFGIARATNRDTVTQQGVLRGKVPYMSPEQITTSKLDRRSDIYSVGTLLYEMTTGRRPFVSEDEFALARLIPEADVPPPSQYRPDYPAGLEQVVVRALQRDLETRYQTARAMAADLEQFAREAGIETSESALSELLRSTFPEGPARGMPVAERLPLASRSERRRRKLRNRVRRLRYLDAVGLGLMVLGLAGCVLAAIAFDQATLATAGIFKIESYAAFREVAQTEDRLLDVALATGLAGALALAASLGYLGRRWYRHVSSRARLHGDDEPAGEGGAVR